METNKGPGQKFLLLCLCSAAAVTVIRLLHAADPDYDLSYQIQAGQNLLAGKGLTIYRPVSENLADPLRLVTLRVFPAGYSLCAGLLIGLGAGPGTVVKVMGAAATMLGWWGWARLAPAYMGEVSERETLIRWGGYFIAIITPLLLTLTWGGTDILLWAAVPWVLRVIVRSSELRSDDSLRSDVAAGALIGLCVLMRYASLFLVAYTGLLMLCQCRRAMASLVRRATAFSLALLPAFAIQVYVNYFLSSGAVGGGGGILDRGIFTTPTRRLIDGLDQLTTANVSLLFWVPQRILVLFSGIWYRPLVLAVTAVVLAMPAVVAATRTDEKVRGACRDVRVVAAGLFTIVPLFLLAAQVVDGNAYGLIPRYYWPTVPLALFVAYSLAARDTLSRRHRITRVLQITGRVYLAAFVIVSSALIVRLPGRGIGRVLGTPEFSGWPSQGLTYDYSPARRYVMAILKARPGAVFITNKEQWFFADPEVDQSRIHPIESCDVLRATHLTGPARLIVLANDPPGGGEAFFWTTTFSQPRHAECFDRLPTLRLLQRFPDERLKVLEGEVPDAVRITLKDVSAPPN